MKRPEYIKLTINQLRRLENAAIHKDVRTFSLIAYGELENPIIRCQRCQATNRLYPHLLHMEESHGVMNYYKTLTHLVRA